VDEKLSLIILI